MLHKGPNPNGVSCSSLGYAGTQPTTLVLQWYRINDDGTRKSLTDVVVHRDDNTNNNIVDYADLPFQDFTKADEGVFVCERTLGDGLKKEANVTIKMIGINVCPAG